MERLESNPFVFSSTLIPAVSLDAHTIISAGRQIGAVLLKRSVRGFVSVDFILAVDDGKLRLFGYDIRVNSYPQSIMTAFALGVCGFVEKTNEVKVLNSINSGRRNRFAVIQTQPKHSALSRIPITDLKKQMYDEGVMFDLRERTGTKIAFYAPGGEGKGFMISLGHTVTEATRRFEEACAKMLKYLSAKTGTDSNSNLPLALQSVRMFRRKKGIANINKS